MRVLDVGCGAGEYEEVDKVEDVHLPLKGNFGVDIGIPKNPKVEEFVQADAHNLPFRDNSFDAVVCYDVIEHLASPIKAVSEMKRVAKKGVIIGTPNPYYLPRLLMLALKGYYSVHFDHKLCFGFAELGNLLGITGLKKLK